MKRIYGVGRILNFPQEKKKEENEGGETKINQNRKSAKKEEREEEGDIYMEKNFFKSRHRPYTL